MGSLNFFINDDYRLPELTNIGLPYKEKAASNGTQGLFENNMCFANIKRGLRVDTPNSNNDSTDDWTSRARASPVVERLIFQELQSDIIEYASTIGVSMDPRQWGVEDTHKWLHWVGDLYHIGDLTNCLSYDGSTLCGFTEEDFIIITGAKDVGQKIAAQLDIWKNVSKMTPTIGSYQFQQQQAMNQKISNLMGRQSNSPKLLDSGCWDPPPPQQFPSNNNVLSTNQFGNGVSNTTPSRGNFPDMRNNNSYQPYNPPNQQLPFRQDPPQGRCTPRPTIPLDRFRSVREACQDNGYLPWEKYQEFTSTTPNRNAQNMMFASTAAVKNTIQMRDTPAASTFRMNNVVETKEEPAQAPATVAMPSTTISSTTPPDAEMNSLSNINNDMHPEYPEVNLLELKTEKTTEACTSEVPMDTIEPKAPEKPPKKKSAKHPIHLWEFLKQLLYDGKECIRWIDQEKGVFKIYNSQEVAKFWGERKNRPAMNYDKLSRSIRQYYKKGIIKKTSQGKRLVYQFCEGYL